jgi:hypothetical protein
MLPAGDWLRKKLASSAEDDRGEMGICDLENRLCKPVPEVAA